MPTEAGSGAATLESWLGSARPVSSPPSARGGGVRFAFYGRTSTLAHQSLQTSRGWQREAAEVLVAGLGSIVVEFFDAGCSRRVPWEGRPQARALVAAMVDPRRVFDAVVVGEYERAFAAGQLEALVPVFQRHGVAVWLPEAGWAGGVR